jgi:hypothetical protein
MTDLQNAIDDLITKQTMSLEGIEIVKKIKDEYIAAQEKIKRLEAMNDNLQKTMIAQRDREDRIEKEYKLEKEAHEKIKLRASEILALEIRSGYEKQRANEIKELFLAIVKNPATRKTATSNFNNVPCIVRDPNGNEHVQWNYDCVCGKTKEETIEEV